MEKKKQQKIANIPTFTFQFLNFSNWSTLNRNHIQLFIFYYCPKEKNRLGMVMNLLDTHRRKNTAINAI